MKPPPFEYCAVSTVEEALDLLAQHGEEAKILAGGQSLVPLLALRLARPEYLVDINGVEALGTFDQNDGLRFGALVRHRTVEKDGAVSDGNPLVAAAARYIGHAAIRNRGTVGGTISHADPAAELPTVLVALDGDVEAASTTGTRTVTASDFFQGFLTTALSPEEMVTAVRFPAWPSRAGWSFREFSRRNGDFAVAGAAVMLSIDERGSIDGARIALSGMSDVPVRASAAEASLIDRVPSREAWKEAAASAVADVEPPSDLHGSSAYRKYVAGGLVESALQEAYERVGTKA
jgi:aerobic carbon-monoxide dehydrogenase medium subunit